ncbi:hypothetical protein VTK73DRAFT_4240 [Phialemonium thermophilum]|uniref:Uncharacterized protein n=1 Tax=Phialemonium thermophilum TaxID=223376 RepID=A0ABR3VAB7_9PEZI
MALFLCAWLDPRCQGRRGRAGRAVHAASCVAQTNLAVRSPAKPIRPRRCHWEAVPPFLRLGRLKRDPSISHEGASSSFCFLLILRYGQACYVLESPPFFNCFPCLHLGFESHRLSISTLASATPEKRRRKRRHTTGSATTCAGSRQATTIVKPSGSSRRCYTTLHYAAHHVSLHGLAWTPPTSHLPPLTSHQTTSSSRFCSPSVPSSSCHLGEEESPCSAQAQDAFHRDHHHHQQLGQDHQYGKS